jgi:hypothetical protein
VFAVKGETLFEVKDSFLKLFGSFMGRSQKKEGTWPWRLAGTLLRLKSNRFVELIYSL